MTAEAGLVFRPKSNIENLAVFVSQLYGQEVVEIEHPNFKEFDVRKDSDIVIQIFGDVWFISNNNPAWDILEHPQNDISATYNLLGSPELFMAYCQYDSGDSFGYAVIQKGVVVRSRLQTDVPRLPPLIEYGTPTEIEEKWFKANYYLEEDDLKTGERPKVYYQGDREITVAQYNLTSRILYELLMKNFGVCAWDTNIRPPYRYFNLQSSESIIQINSKGDLDESINKSLRTKTITNPFNKLSFLSIPSLIGWGVLILLMVITLVYS